MIFFPNIAMRQIIVAAEESCPEEACGLLWGKRCEADVYVASVYQSKNCADDPRTKFEVNPQLRFDLERLAREGEMDVVGLYHSHPNGSAKPSEIDLSRAWETALIWVIIGLEEGKVVERKACKVEKPKERFVEIDLQVVNSQ